MQKLNDWNLSTRAILLDTFGFCRLKVAYVCDVFVERSKIESRVQSRSILAQRNAGLLEIAKLVCCHPRGLKILGDHHHQKAIQDHTSITTFVMTGLQRYHGSFKRYHVHCQEALTLPMMTAPTVWT